MSRQVLDHRGASAGLIIGVRRWCLDPSAAIAPSGIADREAAEVLWPLLADGASRIQLVGRLAVGLGIDTASATSRVERLIGALLADGAITVFAAPGSEHDRGRGVA